MTMPNFAFFKFIRSPSVTRQPNQCDLSALIHAQMSDLKAPTYNIRMHLCTIRRCFHLQIRFSYPLMRSTTQLPNLSTRPSKPGSSHTVVSGCSKIAGPCTTVPTGRLNRS